MEVHCTFMLAPAEPVGSWPYASMRASRVHLPPTSLLAFFLKAGGVACMPYTQIKEQAQKAFPVHGRLRRIAEQAPWSCASPV